MHHLLLPLQIFPTRDDKKLAMIDALIDGQHVKNMMQHRKLYLVFTMTQDNCFINFKVVTQVLK